MKRILFILAMALLLVPLSNISVFAQESTDQVQAQQRGRDNDGRDRDGRDGRDRDGDRDDRDRDGRDRDRDFRFRDGRNRVNIIYRNRLPFYSSYPYRIPYYSYPYYYQTARVQIYDYRFVPSTIVVSRFSSVVWVNYDSAPHTVTSPNGFFGSGILQPGERYSMYFSHPGTYYYQCQLHPEMSGVIIVR